MSGRRRMRVAGDELPADRLPQMNACVVLLPPSAGPVSPSRAISCLETVCSCRLRVCPCHVLCCASAHFHSPVPPTQSPSLPWAPPCPSPHHDPHVRLLLQGWSLLPLVARPLPPRRQQHPPRVGTPSPGRRLQGLRIRLPLLVLAAVAQVCGERRRVAVRERRRMRWSGRAGERRRGEEAEREEGSMAEGSIGAWWCMAEGSMARGGAYVLYSLVGRSLCHNGDFGSRPRPGCARCIRV
jgi:hypothetical protein